MGVSGEFPYFYFFYEKFLHTQKSIKSKQANFTQIFYANKKHKKHRKHKEHKKLKKHKKRLLLTYFMHLKT